MVQARPGLEINTLSTIRVVLEDRPMGGTVKDYRRMVKMLDALDRVASGDCPDMVVDKEDAPLLAQLLEAQVWKTLARPWMEWVEGVIQELNNLAK